MVSSNIFSIKNLHLIYIIIISLCYVETFPQTWKFIGGPQGIRSYDILFTNNGTLISCTYDNIYISHNFGDSWEKKNYPTSIGIIHKITELRNGNLIGVSENGIVLSRDTANTWSLVNSWYGLQYVSAGKILQSTFDTTIFLAVNEQFYKSTDLGVTWHEIWNGGVIDAYTLDKYGNIFIGARPRYLIRSTDNGRTFDTLNVFNNNGNGEISRLFADNMGGVFFMSSVVYPTQTYHYNTNTGLKSIQTGWMDPPLGVTADGKLIFKSSNCIKTYDAVTKNTTLISCQYFIRDQFAEEVITYNNYWIANFQSESLFRSKDDGKTWNDIHEGHGNKQIISVEISKSGRIFAGTFGAYFWGAFYKSDNDGQTWQRMARENIDAYFIDIGTLKNGRIIAMGSYGAYVSDNNGDQWVNKPGISLPYSQFISSTGTIYVGNSYHGVYISRNNGNSWVPANNGINHEYFFGFGESSRGDIYGFSWPSGFYKTIDDGNNWELISDPLFEYSRVYSLLSIDDTIFAGTSIGLVRSNDGGQTWDRLKSVHGSVQKMVKSSLGDLIILLNNKDVYVSSDRIIWEKLSNGLNIEEFVYGIEFDYLNRLFLFTDNGLYRNDKYLIKPITLEPLSGSTNLSNNLYLKWNSVQNAIKYNLSVSKDSSFNNNIFEKEILGTECHLEQLEFSTLYYWKTIATLSNGLRLESDLNRFTTKDPSNFDLRQNYPNPFNSETEIIIDITKNAIVNLAIYDLLGQKIIELFNQELSIGTHKFLWNANNQSSGIYLIRLQTNGFSLVKKAVLIK